MQIEIRKAIILDEYEQNALRHSIRKTLDSAENKLQSNTALKRNAENENKILGELLDCLET